MQSKIGRLSHLNHREKTLRGLKKKSTPILKGIQVYYNFIKPHEGLDGRTLEEACGIQVNRENKWITLMQNAATSAK